MGIEELRSRREEILRVAQPGASSKRPEGSTSLRLGRKPQDPAPTASKALKGRARSQCIVCTELRTVGIRAGTATFLVDIRDY